MNEDEKNAILLELEALRAENEKLVKDRDNMDFERKLETALMNANVRKVSMVKALIDTTKLYIDENGQMQGLSEQLEDIAKEAPSLFFGTEKEDKKVYTGRSGGYVRAESKKTDNPWLKENFNLTKQAEIFNKNPALAKRLMNEASK